MNESELYDSVDDIGVKSAFDEYRAAPGGEIRLDTAAIAGAGRNRVRRHRIFGGAAAVAGVAVLVAGIATVPQLVAGGSGADRTTQVAAPGPKLPTTGRDVTTLFAQAEGQQTGPIKAGGAGATASEKFLAKLGGTEPAHLDSAWQAAPSAPDSATKWGLVTWVDGDRAAEGLLVVNTSPVMIAIYPPPYQVCSKTEQAAGRSCTVSQVKGKGWVKVTRSGTGTSATMRVTLQRMNAGREGAQVTFTVSGGPATKAGLASGRKPMGTLPVDEKTVTEALLQADVK